MPARQGKPLSSYEPTNFRIAQDGTAGNYYLVWSQGRRTPRRSLGTTDREIAEQVAPLVQAAILAPKKAEKDQVPVARVLSRYHDDKGYKHGSKDTSSRIFQGLMDYYADSFVSDINAATNAKYEKDMRKRGLSDSTINRNRNYLRAALRHGVKAEIIASAPDIPTLPEPEPSEDYLEPQQLLALLRACRPARFFYLRLFIHIGYFTAARHEAILSLTWDQVDLDKGWIDFRRRDKKGKLLPRTKKRRPNAPMNPKLRRVLKAAYKVRGNAKNVIWHRSGPLLSVKKAFKAAAARAGLPARLAHPHILKHTCITMMLERGADPWKVAGDTATSLATIERVYGKHIKNRRHSAVHVL